MMKKIMVLLLAAAVGAASVYTVGCAAVTEQRAIVRGTVVAEGLAKAGDQVSQGDVLVRVKSLAGGSVAAARATVAGKVAQVLVVPGEQVAPQQIVARISD